MYTLCLWHISYQIVWASKSLQWYAGIINNRLHYGMYLHVNALFIRITGKFGNLYIQYLKNSLI